MLEELFLKTLPNLGVGVAAVVVLYLVFRIAIEALNKRDEAFQKFVQSHNDEIVRVLTQCRDALQDAAENIKQNTELSKQVVEHLIRERK